MRSLLNAKETRDEYGISLGSLYKFKHDIGFIKKPGTKILFRRKNIEQWLDRGYHKPNQMADVLPKFDIQLDGYDKLFLIRRTELKRETIWHYRIGSVILRKTKDKEDRYYIHFQVNGRRVRHVVNGATTRAQAVMTLNEEVADALRREYRFNRKALKFSEMADLFYEKYSKVNKKSHKTSDWVYLRRLKPYFGDYELSKISPETIEEYRAERLSTGIAKCSVNREVSCLRKIFNVAISWGYIDDNPVSKVKFFSEKENLRERFLSEEEEAKLLKAAVPYLEQMIIVALNTGMRKGEIFNLKWQNVDFDSRHISIKESKSGRERKIPINSTLFSLLCALQAQNGHSEFVFPNPKTNKPFTDVKRSFDSACKAASVEDFRFHDLRHTFATRLVRRGVDLVIIKELMGHASIVTTQRYLHSQADVKSQAVETLTDQPHEIALSCQTGDKRESISHSYAIS